MVAGMVLHLTVFPLIVKVESPSYFQKTNILDSFVVSIFVLMLLALTKLRVIGNQSGHGSCSPLASIMLAIECIGCLLAPSSSDDCLERLWSLAQWMG